MSDKALLGSTIILTGVCIGAVVLAFAGLPDEAAVAEAEDHWGRAPVTLDFPGFDWKSSPSTAPGISFSDAGGNSLDLESFEGRVVLMNIWATWCPPCVHEMPSLDRLEAELGGSDFEVVALSVDREGREAVEPFFEELSLEHLSIYLDPPAEVTRAFNTRGLPTTVLIDRQGRWVGTYEGAMDWDADDVVALMEELIAG